MGICGSWAAALGDGGLPELARFHVFTNVATGWKMAVYGQAALGDGGLPGLARFHVFTNVATGVDSSGDFCVPGADARAPDRFRIAWRQKSMAGSRQMPTIRQCRFTAIDFESAGAARGMTDTPVQIGLAGWSPETGHGDAFVSYLHTDQPVQWSARKVHGIGPEQLAGAPTLFSLWPDLRGRLAGAVVVAHGKGTEKRFLRAFPGHGFGPWVDTLLLARAAWPDHPDHSLGTLCDACGLTERIRTAIPGKSWHDALFDAAASLFLLEHLVVALDLLDGPVDQLLHPDTSAWHRKKRFS